VKSRSNCHVLLVPHYYRFTGMVFFSNDGITEQTKYTKVLHICIFIILSIRKFPTFLLLQFGRNIKCSKCFFFSLFLGYYSPLTEQKKK